MIAWLSTSIRIKSEELTTRSAGQEYSSPTIQLLVAPVHREPTWRGGGYVWRHRRQSVSLAGCTQIGGALQAAPAAVTWVVCFVSRAGVSGSSAVINIM